jgi:hypothetical protein
MVMDIQTQVLDNNHLDLVQVRLDKSLSRKLKLTE